MIDTKEWNTWTVLDPERMVSFVKYAHSYNIDQGSKLGWNDNMLLNVLPYCQNKRVAIDVGASYGFVSNELASEFESVISSEIISEVRHCLKRNMRFNRNVTVVDYGFSNFIGKTKMNFYPAATGHTTKIDIPYEKFKIRKTFRICPVMTLDWLTYGREDIDLIKIDVEGSELKVLEGAKNLLSRCSPVLIVEIWHHDTENTIKIIDFLKTFNYQLVTKFKEDHMFIKR